MVSFPTCKINLGLHVLRKRADGYHDLATCFYPVPWTDILEIILSDKMSFTSTGLSIPGNDNLCIQAYQLLKNDFDLPSVKIHLHKINFQTVLDYTQKKTKDKKCTTVHAETIEK